MKKHLLSTGFLLASGLLFGQGEVVVQVLSPASIAMAYENAFAVAASGWGVADLTLPENSVTNVLRIASDGTAADSLGCETLVNAGDIAGKIAVVYRGTCPFSQKAFNAQQAGAVAVLLISNGDALNINMQGGTLGPDVTIPVAMISQTSGAAIRPVIDTEDVTALIGNNFGAFANNLKISNEDVLIPSASAVPALIATSAADYQVPLGAFVFNFGSEEQTTARLRAVVTEGTTEVYNEVSENQVIASGDTLFIALPQFSQPSYASQYTITYTVESDGDDGYPADNSFALPLTFGEILSYVAVDLLDGLPTTNNHVTADSVDQSFRTCIQFTDTNASRMTATGIYFSAQTPDDLVDPQDSVLTDLLVTAQVYRWVDPIANAFTRPSSTGLETLTYGEYSYPSDLQEQMIFVPLEDPITFEDNDRYLFCIGTTDPFVRHGWNDELDYLSNAQFFAEPTTFIQSDGEWFNGFTGLTGSPSLGVRMIDANSIGIEENADRVEITPFPNPTRDFLSIPVKNFTGTALLRIFDMNGRSIADQRVAVGANSAVTVDVTSVSAGTYLFHMEFENGQRSDFRVVVTK